MGETVRHYASDAIDVTYEARRCIHAAECLRGLPAVFDTARRPRILPTGAEETRLALCRCGQSRNKPFCGNGHRAAGFDDPGADAE